MEQRDAIVKNLREISHFFLSESKSNAHPHANQGEPVANHKKPADSEPDELPVESENIKYIFNSHAFHPLVQYVIHYDHEIRVTAQVLNIALELTGFGNKTCIVGKRQIIQSLIKTFEPVAESVSSHKDGDEAEIFYLKMKTLDLPLILIGRKTHLWNAQISHYLDGVRKVFITDFTVNTVKELITPDNKLHLIFFTRPEPDKAFQIYADLRNLYRHNSALWCGVIVSGTQSVSEGLNVYNSISATLTLFDLPNPHYLGYISGSTEGISMNMENDGSKSDFYLIADRLVYHLPFIISSSKSG